MRALIADMFETMYAAPASASPRSRSACPSASLVIDLQEPEEEDGEPVASRASSSTPRSSSIPTQDVLYNEGCLSVPDQYAEVERPDRIRARWLDENGDAQRRSSTACSRSASSTRWTISKAYCSSTISRA